MAIMLPYMEVSMLKREGKVIQNSGLEGTEGNSNLREHEGNPNLRRTWRIVKCVVT